MTARLDGKVALITGGGSGIGRASARAFAREGGPGVGADADVAGGEETCRQLNAAGAKACFLKVDVSRAGDVAAMVRQIAATYNRLDCAFNNAGVAGTAFVPIPYYDEAVWDEVI